MSDREQHLETLLAEGLNLCVRARQMDAMDRREATLELSSDPEGWVSTGQFDRHVERHNYNHPSTPIASRSGTVHLWLQEQYETDLADWEKRARDFLMGRRDHA